jgi:hypothetical protein
LWRAYEDLVTPRSACKELAIQQRSKQGVDNFAACQQGFSDSTAGGRGVGHPAVGGEVSASSHQYSIGHPLQQVGKVLILSGHQQPCIMQKRGQRSYSKRKRCQRPATLLWAISSTSQGMVICYMAMYFNFKYIAKHGDLCHIYSPMLSFYMVILNNTSILQDSTSSMALIKSIAG